MIDEKIVLSDITWGLERETHRIRPDGSISTTLHPAALAKPGFTKDFAESQLELVTKPHHSISETLRELKDLTLIAHKEIGAELLWPFSMPPRLGDENGITTARMGNDDTGRLAEMYRRGLISRYGAARQMICGVHVNVSFGRELLLWLQRTAPLSADERTNRTESDGYYLRLMRNMIEDLPYLVTFFGASPVIESVDTGSAGRTAFSFRNSPYGYARKEYRPFLELGSVREHLEGIRRGMATESLAFSRLGLVREGKAIQLNNRIFQKDKEFYAPIRFRRNTSRTESPIDAIERKGVEYMELRFYDIEPFTPLGVSVDSLNLTHLFLLDDLSRVSARRSNESLTEILDGADDAALSDPLAIRRPFFLGNALKRLASVGRFAESLGPEYKRAVESYSRALDRGGESLAARTLKKYRASGLAWTQYGASLAERNRSDLDRLGASNANS